MLQDHKHATGWLIDREIALSEIREHPVFAQKAKVPPHIYDSKRTGFLKLPGELRNNIYRLIFAHSDAINGTKTKLPAIALLRTCKKVHDEAASILYTENTFTFGIIVNFSNFGPMGLVGFPNNWDVWPANTYLKWLKKLHIGISFTPGNAIDFSAPACLLENIRAMRLAYNDRWHDLDITYELCEGTTHMLTFTMAWLKFRCFQPIAHPRCKIIMGNNIPPIVRWCFERTMRGRDPTDDLHGEQRAALQEAKRIAWDSYTSGMHKVCTDLSWRLVWGCPIGMTRPGLFGLPNTALFPLRRRIYDQREIYRLVETTMTDRTVTDILMEDNEWRTLAALEMPQEKDLLIEKCAELRMYFALQEMASKVIALENSLQSS